MATVIRIVSFVVGSFVLAVAAQARVWTDASGRYEIEASLFGFDGENVVLQRENNELGELKIVELSEPDRAYLTSKDAEEINDRNIKKTQRWTTQSGVELVGRVVDYARGPVVIQRRRGRMYVNDRAFTNLPAFYQILLPQIVEQFEGIEIPDDRALQNWLLSLRGQPRTFQVEGVILETENADEYAIPFFVFSKQDQNLLKAGWAEWLADQKDCERRREDAFRLESLAAAHFHDQQINRQIALMNLNLQAIQAGLTSAWEVTLYPVPGNPRPPHWVVMPGRNSAQATAAALQNNPGFMAGPVRRIRR
jgi:hypothetical protein